MKTIDHKFTFEREDHGSYSSVTVDGRFYIPNVVRDGDTYTVKLDSEEYVLGVNGWKALIGMLSCLKRSPLGAVLESALYYISNMYGKS